jgi:hypothetical protein
LVPANSGAETSPAVLFATTTCGPRAGLFAQATKGADAMKISKTVSDGSATKPGKGLACVKN